MTTEARAAEGPPWKRDGLAATHRRLLDRWRDAMNLVGPGSTKTQLEDCRRALDVVDDVPVDGVWVDLGSGAGLPGLVFAARFPDAETVLVESRRKRASFLENVVVTSGATGVEVLCERAEDLVPEAFDGVIARGFAPPDGVLMFADTLLVDGGVVVLFLQGHVEPPVPPMFTVERVHDYEVDGLARRSVRLRKTG